MTLDDSIIFKDPKRGYVLLLDASTSNRQLNDIYQKQTDSRTAVKVEIIGLEVGSNYTLPIASASTLGGIKVGSGLSINPTTGVLSATGGGGGVSSISAGTGISIGGTPTVPIVTNTLPDQTVVLNAGSGISVTGTYPNFTITNSSPSSGGTVTSIATAGLISGGTITNSGTITTSINTNKLVGRSTLGVGVMEEITLGTGLSFTGTTLNVTSASPLTTKGDLYTYSTANTRLPVGLDTQVLIADSTTPTGIKWGSNTTPPASGYYGSWQDNITQTAATSNVGYEMIFRTVDLSNGVTIVTNGTNLTRITFANTGIYNLQFSSQFQNLANSPQDVTIWLRKNGTDVSGSAGIVGLEARKNPSDPYHIVTGWNYVLSVIAGEYYELVWSTTDHTNVQMKFYAAGSPPPSAASVIMTVTQQSGILAGTSVTAIN